MILQTPTTWGISISDFEKGKWGTAIGKFKVPNSVIKRFRKTVWQNKDTNEIVTIEPDDLTNWEETNIFDVERAFDEIAITYINAIVASYEILRNASFNLFDEDTRDCLRKAVYNAVEYSCLNRQIWENVNGSSITTPNFTVAQDQTSWLLSKDMIGMKADNYLTQSGIEDYEWLQDSALYKETKNNNLKVIASMDEVYQEALQDPSDGYIWIGTENEIEDLLEAYNL